MKIFNKLTVSLFFSLACVCVQAQETRHPDDSLTVFFRQGVSAFEPGYKQNAQRCQEFVSRLSDLQNRDHSVITRVNIHASASPEGHESINARLAKERVQSVTEYLHHALTFQDSIVFVNAITEDWDGLAQRVEADPAVPCREEVISIIADKTNASRKANLMKLDNGRPWRYLYKKYFPQLRSFRVAIYTTPIVPDVELEEFALIVIEEPFEALQNEPATLEHMAYPPTWIREITLKTNVIGWGMGHQNIAAEFDLVPHLSVAVPFYYSGGFDYFSPTLKFRGIVVQPELRYYPWLKQQRNDGFFVGAHFGLGWYNFALNGDFRIQDSDGRRPSWGGGLGLGYSLQFLKSPRWGMEFAVGAGIYDSKYDMFYNEENGPVYKTGIRKTWIGVDNASISFTYKFDVTKKGGKK